ncbi:MAG: PEGA domain-containing protein [Spirochaetaceae bacterium]|nr:MAG: PEGA domain-containing protein [Spirochaetaceae bacterium]
MRSPKSHHLPQLVFIPLLLIMCVAPLTAVDKAPREVEALLPEDAGELWRLGFASLAFDAEELGSEYRHLATGIPLLLMNDFSELERRVYQEEERAAMSEKTVKAAQRDAGRQLKELRDQRDAVVFARLSRREREERQASLAAQVRTAEMELARIMRYDPGRLEFPQEGGIELVNKAAGVLASSARPARIVREEGLDALVYGSLTTIGEYLHLEVALYSEALGRDLGRVTLTALPEELASLLHELEDDLGALLLGREVARVRVSPGRGDVAVFLNDELLGYGEVEQRFVPPGLHEVRIEGRNLPVQTRTLSLAPRARAEMVFEPEPEETRAIIVESMPSGADVYSDSVWIGRTPLRVELGESNEHIVLLRDGFYRSQLILGAATPNEVQRDLEIDRGGEGGLIERRRNSFYTAFGLFVLSVPVALLSNGIYENLSTMVPPDGGRAPGLSDSEADRLRRQRDIAYYATWGGVAVSTGLFVTSAIQLGRYVRAAQASHTR